MNPALSVRGLTKEYPGPVVALRDVTVDVAPGEIVAVVGPSGSGKSTLLRIVAGLEAPTRGEVLIDGAPAPPSPRERDVALVFQSHSLFPHLTAFENMAYGLRVRGRGAEAKALVEAAARRLGLVTLLARYPAALSGGERQRVALGRALARKACFLLLDEPLASLDAHLRAELRRLILEVHRELRGVTLLVTHDQTEALSLADRVLVLGKGVVQQVGTPQVLLDRPANRFVAGFIGVPAASFHEGHIDEDGASFRGPEMTVPLVGRWREAFRGAGGQPVSMGVRPDRWIVGEGQSLPGEVVWIERTGTGLAHVHVRVGGGEAAVALPAAAVIPVGTLRLRPDPEHVLFFDLASGESLDPDIAKPGRSC